MRRRGVSPLAWVMLLQALLLVLPSALSAQPTESDVFVAEGMLALEDRRYEEALAHFQRALARDADHVEALYYSGVSLMALGRTAEALPFLQRAWRLAPRERSIAFQLGLAHFALEQYEAAEPLLEEAFAADPRLDGAGYYVGFLRYRRRDMQGALRAFRAGHTTDPDLAQLTRIYTGLALAALGLPAQAAAAVEEALRLAPSSPLTGPAERLRDSLVAARRADRRFRAHARAGFYFDDNVTAEPNRLTGNETITALRRRKNETTGELLALRLEYDWYQEGPWAATVGYSFFTTYNNDLPSFNILDHLATVGVRHRTALGAVPVISGLTYSYDYLMLDEEEFLQRHTVSLSSTLVEDALNLTSLQGRFEMKEFSLAQRTPPEEDLDAVNWMAGVIHVFRFAQDRHFIKVGYQVDWEDAQGDNYAYVGHRLLAGAQYTLPWRNIRLTYDFSFHHRDYQNHHTFLPAPDRRRERRDSEYSHVARIDVPLTHGLTLGLDYLGTVARSNLDVFSYTRDVYTLSLSWQY
jgi:tetratricopeptide (TPR) repeat protein